VTYPENNAANRCELIENIISGWDVEDLYTFVVNTYANDYKDDQATFENDWNDFKDSYDWTPIMLKGTKKDCPNPGCHCGACEKEDDGSDTKQWQVDEATDGRR
tara:strand:+ start:1096 stop:1407 length:312 start_codon:yes stop_codon:yes gene_type:complete